MNFKSILACAALLIGVGTATAAVESDIVGYTTIEVEANKWYLIGSQFKGLESTTDTIPINQLCSVSGIEPVTFSESRASGNAAAQIQVYNGVGYDIYYYISDAIDATGPCWTNTRRPLADTVTLPLGGAYWFKTPSNVAEGAKITVAGKVKTDATTVTTEIEANGWKQLSNPFPVDLTLDMMSTTLTPVTFQERLEGLATEIQVYNGVGYDQYYYISDAIDATGPCWTGTRRQLPGTTVIAKVGKGFWVKSTSAGTLTFSLNP